jgi:Tfp pilus assembly protein PilX
MNTLRHNRQDGSTTIIALLTLFILTMVAVGVLRTTVPRYQVAHQAAGWQEARLAADAGIDIALERLNRNVPNPAASTADWSGWKRTVSTAATGLMLARSNATAVTGLTATGSTLIASPSIHLDNVDVSPTAGTIATTDIQLTALYTSSGTAASAINPWFRIRSMGTASVGGPPRAAIDKMDTTLRRLSLRAMRPSLAANDVLTTSTVPFPNASRIVEVLARPVTPFTRAIETEDALTLGNSNNWEVNSYDSADNNKSNNGLYPGDSSPKIQSNGDIASNKRNPDAGPYGALITANGAQVLGNVSTNGGDNPNTSAFENISGAGGIDSTRISSDFTGGLDAPPVPTVSSYTMKPSGYQSGTPFPASGSNSTDVYYRVYTTDPALGSFAVSGTGRITIFIDGNWNIGTGAGAAVTIPPGVNATIYVKGNVDFGNGLVNMNALSSKKPGNLMIYGIPDPNPDGTLPARTLSSNGNPEIAAAFYGPSYRANFKGTAEWYGAIACYSYQITGGGNGGFHYDEALSGAGFIKKFLIYSHYEDSRQ